MSLPLERYDLARNFPKNHARKLDLALSEHEFESGTMDAVLKELKKYQNDDGGFGNALEPDLRCIHKGSSFLRKRAAMVNKMNRWRRPGSKTRMF